MEICGRFPLQFRVLLHQPIEYPEIHVTLLSGARSLLIPTKEIVERHGDLPQHVLLSCSGGYPGLQVAVRHLHMDADDFVNAVLQSLFFPDLLAGCRMQIMIEPSQFRGSISTPDSNEGPGRHDREN